MELQLSLFDLIDNLPQCETPMVRRDEPPVGPEPASPTRLMDALVAPVLEVRTEEARPVDPRTPPITGPGVPPVVARVFIKKTWKGSQSFYGYLYGWKTLTQSGKRVRMGQVALDDQDFRKGHYYIPEDHVEVVGA